MKARDIMHSDIYSVGPDDSLLDAAKLMLERKISGLLVMDGGNLIGILTEGDLLRRSELDTGRKRSGFAAFFTGPGKLAGEYVRTTSRKVHALMTRSVATVDENAGLQVVVDLMEAHHVKRLPVMSGNAVIGMISRADVMRAFVNAATRQEAAPLPDEEIRSLLLAYLEKQPWCGPNLVNVKVKNGEVSLEGVVMDPRQTEAFEVAAENIPGVKKVNDRMIWIDPISGSAFDANNQFVEPER